LVVGDLHEAEDLVQETLLKVARRWPRVRRMDHAVPYARRILVNLALRDRPKRSRRRAELSEANGDRPALPAIPVERHDEVHAALAALPPRQRAVLVLRYFLDLPETEVAAALHCPTGTVKSTASRALARLVRTLRTGVAAPRAYCVRNAPTPIARAGSGVRAARLTLDDGLAITATVEHGWAVAWWPGPHHVAAARLTTATGTRTQTFTPYPCDVHKCRGGGPHGG
jgi:RNA polymerase sigma factor (sigma-70 family)